jgi:transcriptional regulator with XRE-family HTH domain
VTETLGQRIRRLRQARGWSQMRLGLEAGLSAVSVCHWETGRCVPDSPRLAALARALGVSMDALWQGWERWDREAGA